MPDCPVCGRAVPELVGGRVAFHYERTSAVNDALRVCIGVDVRRDDFRTIAQLQHSRALALAVDRLVMMVATAAPVLERVAVAIEERTRVARAAEERSAKSADEYLRALEAMDSGPVPSLVDDDDGSH